MAVIEKFKSFVIDKIRLIHDSLLVHSTGIPNYFYLDNSANQSWPCEFATFQCVCTDFIANFTKFSKGGSRILARGVHMSDGNAQEAQSLYVRQCIIHAFKRVRAVV